MNGKPTLALRVITTAYCVLRSLSLGGFIDLPDPNMEVEVRLILLPRTRPKLYS